MKNYIDEYLKGLLFIVKDLISKSRAYPVSAD
jgi:hypothetical protein